MSTLRGVKAKFPRAVRVAVVVTAFVVLLAAVGWSWYQAHPVLVALAGMVGAVLGAISPVLNLIGKRPAQAAWLDSTAIVGAVIAIAAFLALLFPPA